MKVIVAEKPSVAKNIAEVVGADDRQDGFIQGNGYTVTWALGHLVELWDAKDYDEKYAGAWNLDDWPFLPNPFRYRIADVPKRKGPEEADYRKRVRAQYNVVKKLINHANCEEVICATDAGREGELIFRLIYNLAECKKPASRLWISSMEQSVIRQGIDDRKPLSAYDDLYAAALARQQADWDVGINFSVYYSVKYGGRTVRYTAGRVQTVVNHFIVQRCYDIENFVPVPYYLIKADLGGFIATHREETFEAAEQCVRNCVYKDALCKTVKKEKKTVKQELLYNLGDFQKDCNNYFGLSASEAEDVLQSLYEKKLVTYPRTESKYIEQAQEQSVIALIPHIKSVVNSQNDFVPNTKRIVNDAKVTDHHAVLPTQEVKSLGSLDTLENKCLALVCWRLLIATAPQSTYESTVATFDIAGYEFKAEGQKILELGFRALQAELNAMLGKKSDKKENILPDLFEGNSYKVGALDNEQKQTEPPKYYTDATILTAMETAGKELDDEELKDALKGVGIGTPATRAEIIEKLIRIGYIIREKGKLYATEKGKNFDRIADEKIKSPAMTGEWEQQLADIAKGELPKELFMSDIEDFVYTFYQDHRNDEGETPPMDAGERNVIGRCPKCGNEVVDVGTGWICSAGKENCGFVIWKKMGNKEHPKTISETQARKLLEKGRSDLLQGFVGNSGKTFDAFLIIREDKSGVDFDFGSGTGAPAIVGKCPVCGSDVVGGSMGWSCSKEGCKFIVWRKFGNKEHPKILTDAQVKKLLSAKRTDLIKGFVGKNGKKFDAYLVLKPDNTVGFEFPSR